MQQETIFALSTPPGKSGVAVIRISGTQTTELLFALTQKGRLPAPRQATLSTIYHRSGAVLDRALLLYFKAPHSFTGEDMLELQVHGGIAIIRSLMAELAGYPGVRPAEPGEFMRRAFLSGKADLLEVEAIADMIDAETAAQLAQAAKQMQGHHSAFYRQLRASIVEVLALLEAYIDFPEEDIPESVLAQVSGDIQRLKTIIISQLDDSSAAERLRSGFRVAIVGAPNVGKSTLLNALARREAAIVTPHAGTTRDVIELHMDVAGYPIILSDTAGIRNSEDEVEKLGIARTRQNVDLADALMLMVDAGRFHESLEAVQSLLNDKGKSPCLFIVNKTDLLDVSVKAKIVNTLNGLRANALVIWMEAKSGDGLSQLEDALAEMLATLMPSEDSWVTRYRHRALLADALGHISADCHALPLELYAEEIRLAALSIGKITGAIIADELLETIFSRFCIGK